MPSFDPQDRARLNHYASDLRIWFQEWLLEPVQKATGGIIPAALSTLYADMNELENEFGRQLDQSIGIDDRHAPLLKRILRSEEHTSELQSLAYIVCRLLLEKKNSTDILNLIGDDRLTHS